MPDVINLQRKIDLDLGPIRAFASLLSSAVPEAATRGFSIAFISDRRMTGLNEVFRGKKTTTDVLSFPFEAEEFELPPDGGKPSLGDIVISVEQAARQALDAGLPLETEIKQLILHGLLHLSGMDHESDDGEMNTRELALREQLSIS